MEQSTMEQSTMEQSTMEQSTMEQVIAEIAKMSTMDKLFIHLISAPNAAYAKQYKVINDDGKELFKGSFIACADFMYAPAQEEILQEIHIVPVEESKEKDNA